MLRPSFVVLAAGALLWLAACSGLDPHTNNGADGPQTEPAERRPNILLFLVDDLGWQDTSVAMSGRESPFQTRYRTPNLERLAERGVRFSNAYASAPVCTPTRTAIMTGKAPARTKITYWTLHKNRDTSRQRDDLAAPNWRINGLQPGDHETLPQVLRTVGYRTIHVGKAHFGVHDTPGGDPLRLGFDVNIAGHASGAPGSFLGQHHFSQSARQGNAPRDPASPWDVPGLEKYHGQDIFLTEALALEACAAIQSAVDDEQPFFMNFAPYAVHTPIMANPRYVANYPGMDAKERAYASMIESYDAALGRIVAKLEATEQIEQTVILFHSDNGGLSAHARGTTPTGQGAHHHNAPLRSGKGSAYEGGTRVPLIIAWPGVTDKQDRAGSIETTPVISHDLFPTAIALAGLQADYGPAIDGWDLTSFLTGRSALFPTMRGLLWNQPHQWGVQGPGIEPFTSVRSGDWKLIYFHAGPRFELYDLGNDPGEQNDLARKQPEIAASLGEVMQATAERSGAQLSIDKATGKPIPQPSEALREFLATE